MSRLEVPGSGGRGQVPAERALGLFDAVARHPWLAAQITRDPWGPVTLRAFRGFGRPIQALGVPERDWFTMTSTPASTRS
ncbi:hypothetical protein [Nonomuraea sp. NPDC049309]|uniref:hypothetical protein n=1 Tax=Nonomuraea sp. NPDC049309 TaxID=3364350 RepID=UPI00371B3DC5